MFDKKCDSRQPMTEIPADGKDAFKDNSVGVFDELALIPVYVDNLPVGLIQDEL